MEPSLEAVQFLANSANRVQVLTALIDGEATRRDLEEEVEGSRSTVARILDEAQEREWVDSEGTRYWLTPLGELMVTDFRSYLATVEGYQQLGELVNHLPPPLFSLDSRHYRDADIVKRTADNPGAPFTRALKIFRQATEYRGLNSTALPDHVKVLRERAEQGRLDFEQVLEKAFVETIRANPERSAEWKVLSDRVWLYDGIVPINVHIVDGVVVIWLGENRNEVEGLFVSENSSVVSWAESLYEEYLSESKPLGEL